MRSQNVPQVKHRSAVGYVRVSTSMQAEDGLSLEAQTVAIKKYCSSNGLALLKIYADVESGGKSDRKGLAEALSRKADVFIVLKFDRLSRSIKHFCQLYEDYFSGKTELVAIREAIRLDSALGRALVNVLMVFAQMEREATGERTRESISYIRASGYHFGKVRYGMSAVPAPDNPRYQVLVENKAQQAVLSRIRAMVENNMGLSEIATILNSEKIAPPRGKEWTKILVYHLKRRNGWHTEKPVNIRQHSDDEVKARMSELRRKGHTLLQVANILNEENYKPYKGKKFSESSVCKLLGGVKTTKVVGPREYCEQFVNGGVKPSLAKLAEIMSRSGYLTPRGNGYWWPAQVRELLAGRFDEYYRQSDRKQGIASAPMEDVASVSPLSA